jgi:hypothetical protein
LITPEPEKYPGIGSGVPVAQVPCENAAVPTKDRKTTIVVRMIVLIFICFFLSPTLYEICGMKFPKKFRL